ncbi:MAG: hypothetical protein ACYC99_15705, partial [Candidatus Geothermincolia bacterium]
AMMSDRPYRKALPVPEALKELEINAGTQFDPVVVTAFMEAFTEDGAEDSTASVSEEIDSSRTAELDAN